MKTVIPLPGVPGKSIIGESRHGRYSVGNTFGYGGILYQFLGTNQRHNMKTTIEPTVSVKFTGDYARRFAQWKSFANNIRERGERLARERMDAAFALAATVGIPRDMCCLHNASIDDNLSGWCKDNPQRLKVAKRANYMANELAWLPTGIATRIIDRAWAKMAGAI